MNMENNKLEVTEPVYQGIPDIAGRDLPVPSRTDIRKASAVNVMAAGADEVFGGLFETLGMTSIEQVHLLVPSEINQLTREILAIRAAQDILTGRGDALKKYATDVINLQIECDGKDPSTEGGVLEPTEFRVRLSKEVSGNKLTLDTELLKNILDSEQYNSIINIVETVVTTTYPDGRVTTQVNIVHEVNEDCLEREVKKGNIGMEQLVQAAVTGKSRTAFYVRNTK
jgi:hypothetical protein